MRHRRATHASTATFAWTPEIQVSKVGGRASFAWTAPAVGAMIAVTAWSRLDAPSRGGDDWITQLGDRMRIDNAQAAERKLIVAKKQRTTRERSVASSWSREGSNGHVLFWQGLTMKRLRIVVGLLGTLVVVQFAYIIVLRGELREVQLRDEQDRRETRRLYEESLDMVRDAKEFLKRNGEL